MSNDQSKSGKSYKGSCFCGAVQFTVSGDPAGMGYCHCESCRHWSAGPVNAFTLWQPQAVQITRGADNIGSYNKTPHSYRKWCKTCGGHILTEHPGMGLTDVYAAVLRDFPYAAGVHVNYQETRLRIKDGLPKLKDFPKELGGSGLSLPEETPGRTLPHCRRRFAYASRARRWSASFFLPGAHASSACDRWRSSSSRRALGRQGEIACA
jgi:hypothetical protein